MARQYPDFNFLVEWAILQGRINAPEFYTPADDAKNVILIDATEWAEGDLPARQYLLDGPVNALLYAFLVSVWNDPGTPNFLSDLWQDFDFTPLTTGNLDDHDHFDPTGRWAITDASSKLSTGVAAEEQFLWTINGLSDEAGTRGLIYNCSGGAQAYLAFTPTTQKALFSGGFRFKFPATFTTTFGEYDLGRLSVSLGAAPALFKIVDDTNETRFHTYTPGQGYSDGIPVLADTWYWMTFQWTADTVGGFKVRLYTVDGAQLGDEQVQDTPDDLITQFLFGPIAGGPDIVGELRLDDLVMNWTTAPFPLGGPLSE